jgi:nicotinate-nucleotide adenylyltransferase
MKIAIFGGTFDPFHLGHLKIALEASKQYDIVYIVPTTVHYYKATNQLFSFEDRIRIIQELLHNTPKNIIIDTIERNQDDKWRTINTVEYFHNKFPNDELYLIIGEDSYEQFTTWFRYDDILNLCNLTVVKRSKATDTIDCDQLYIGNDFIETSSTKIRQKLIDELVDMYISDKDWYNATFR